MSYPLSRLSSASSAFSDTLEYASSQVPVYSYGPPPSSTGTLSPPSSPASHSRKFSLTGTGRSRARRLSLLSSPNLGGAPFGGRRESDAFGAEYDEALAPDEELEMEMDVLGGDDVEEGKDLGRRRPFRETFQPLTAQEIWWMIFSSSLVLALTVVACVVTAIA